MKDAVPGTLHRRLWNVGRLVARYNVGSDIVVSATFKQKVRSTMVPMRFKVGFVTFLSCLTLLLGLFFSTGIASAHSVQAHQAQTSASVSTNDRCFRIFVRRHHRFGDFGYGDDEGGFFRFVCYRDHRGYGDGYGDGYG